jgi:renalase
VPQSLAILAAGEVALPEAVWNALEPIDYASCLTLLAVLAGPSRIPEPGGLWMSGEPLLWMADNQRKGVSAGAGTATEPGSGAVVTVHAGPEFSREHWETPEAEVVTAMLAAAEPWLGSAVRETQLHRWRYSVPLRVHPEACLVVPGPAPLAFAGGRLRRPAGRGGRPLRPGRRRRPGRNSESSGFMTSSAKIRADRRTRDIGPWCGHHASWMRKPGFPASEEPLRVSVRAGGD